MTVVDIAAVDRRPECDVSILGASRGGSASQKHVVRTAQQSTAYRFRIGYTDAVAGRADALESPPLGAKPTFASFQLEPSPKSSFRTSTIRDSSPRFL
jgi:hypothetical protein